MSCLDCISQTFFLCLDNGKQKPDRRVPRLGLLIMANLNTLPITPSEPYGEDPIFLILSTYAHTGTDDAWLETQMAIQSLATLQSAQNVFSVLENIYRRAQTAVPPVGETTLERQRAVLEALQARASHLQAREQEKQFVAQRERDSAAENTQVGEQRDAKGARLQTLRIGPDSNGTESALLAAADRYDLDRASALIDSIDNVNPLNRTFEASVIVLETSSDVARQRSHTLLQELLRQRVRELSAEAQKTEQMQTEAVVAQNSISNDNDAPSELAQQQKVRDILQSKIERAAEKPSVGEPPNGSGLSWADSLNRLPCWVVFLGGVVILALFVALVAFISGVISRNRAMKKQKKLDEQQQQQIMNAFAYNMQRQQQQQQR